jgi:hypothetical protein
MTCVVTTAAHVGTPVSPCKKTKGVGWGPLAGGVPAHGVAPVPAGT